MGNWQNLNLLRGFGALMIVIHHANSASIPFLAKAPGIAGFIIARTKNWGWSGIDLFFVLGGFLMAHTFCRHFERYHTIDIKSYYKARGKRIIPSYYFLLIILAVTGATGWLDLSSWPVALKDILTHFLFLNNYLDELPNGPTWYLAAMVQIYLFMPLLLLVVSRIHKTDMEHIIQEVAVTGIVFVLVLRCWTVIDGAHEPDDFMETHFRVDTVLQGMLAYCLFKMEHPVVSKLKLHPYLTVCLASLLILPCAFLPRRNPYMFSVGFTFLALGYSMLILLIIQCKLTMPKFISIFLLAVSTWSYNIYLWHFFISKIVGQPFTDLQFVIDTTINSPTFQATIQMLIFTVISITAGFLMTNLVEKPAVKFMA